METTNVKEVLGEMIFDQDTQAVARGTVSSILETGRRSLRGIERSHAPMKEMWGWAKLGKPSTERGKEMQKALGGYVKALDEEIDILKELINLLEDPEKDDFDKITDSEGITSRFKTHEKAVDEAYEKLSVYLKDVDATIDVIQSSVEEEREGK